MNYELEKRFCKDRKLPINVFEEPYFSNRLKLLGELDNYQNFRLMVRENFASDQDYFAYYNAVKDKVIEFIKNSEAYKQMQTDPDIKQPDNPFGRKELYKPDAAGHRYISIDMKSANFTALVHYGKTHGCDFFDSYDYKDFISRFTHPKDMHIVDSKYIRQVIFGNCNPKRQTAYETMLMKDLLDKMIDAGMVAPKNVYSLTTDEIILKGYNRSDKVDMDAFMGQIQALATFPVKGECFVLGRVTHTEAYVKAVDLPDGQTAFQPKCVNPDEMPFVYRTVQYQDIETNDYYFSHHGRMARFVNFEKPQMNFAPNMYIDERLDKPVPAENLYKEKPIFANTSSNILCPGVSDKQQDSEREEEIDYDEI